MAKKNGSTNGHHVLNGVAVVTVTFRIPLSLKRQIKASVKKRGTTMTRFALEAFSNEVSDLPPRWWSNREQKRIEMRLGTAARRMRDS
jgi:hypothetical protein